MIIGILARHRLDHDAFRQLGVTEIEELLGRDKFTARVARHIGHKHLHLGNLVLFKPVLDSLCIGIHTLPDCRKH